MLQVPGGGCAWTSADRSPTGPDGIVLMSHSLSTPAASCSLQVSNLVGKPIVLARASSSISNASEAALDRARFVYETDWQVVSRHVEPHSSILGRAPLTARQPTLVLRQQDATTLEFSLASAFLLGHATSHAFYAMSTCSAHIAWTQELAAKAGREAAAELLTFATEQVLGNAAGVAGNPASVAGVLGMQSMQRVAAMELGMVRFASADVGLAHTQPLER